MIVPKITYNKIRELKVVWMLNYSRIPKRSTRLKTLSPQDEVQSCDDSIDKRRYDLKETKYASDISSKKRKRIV